MQPLINLALANKEEQEKFKRNTVDITQSLVGVGVTGMAAFYTFRQQNKQSNLLKSISGIGNSLKQKQTDSDSVKTISREIKELVLSKQKEKLEAKTRNQVSVMSLLSDSSKSVDDKYNELLKLGKNERVAHLSTMMSMVNDPNLGIEDLKKQQLTINLKNSIQLEGQNLELKEQQAIKQILSNFGLHTSVDTQDKYTSLYQYNLNLSKNNLISSVVDENGNASTMRSNLSNTYDNINKASGEIGKVNEHIFKTFNNINDNALFDSIEKDPGVGSGNRSTVEQTIKARYNRISKILKNAPGFDIEIVGVQEKDQGVSAYARLTRKSGVGQSIEPIVMPLYLSNKGQFGRESKYARMNSSLSSTSLAPSYVLDLNDVKNIIEDQTLNQQAKKRAIQDLMKSNQYEDALINILEKTYDNGTLKNIDQHGRNELMEVMRGFTSDINQSMSGEKSKGWFTSTKQKSTSQINSNKIHFTFDPTKTTNKDIEQLIPKLAELQLGFQGLSGSGAGIKKYSVNNKEIGVRMAYAAVNAEGASTITPYNILRPLGVSNEMITPGASRPGQLFDKNEAFLGFVGKGQNVEGNVSATFGFNNDIKVVAQKGKDLLNVGTQSLGKDLDIVAANTPVIIHFDEMAKKGQAIGLADAMSYAGGEMVVAKSLKKNINYSEGMKELAIYQSDEFKKLLTGEVLELEGDALTNFFNKFSDDQGRLIIGESDIGPEFIHRTSAMRKLRLQIAKNVDKGNAKQLQLIGEAIGVEQGSKIFSEVIKGTQYGVQNVLSETSFQEVISKAGGEGDFLQLAKTKFGLTNTTNLLLTGQDVVTKAPSYLASYMFGGLRGLGFTEDQLHKDIFDKNKYTGDIIDPTDTTAVKQYQTSYLQQTAKNILSFMLDQKVPGADPTMAGQITEETIGAILTSSQKLDVYKSKKEDRGFLEQLLDDKDVQDKLSKAGLNKDKIIKRANTGFGFGYVSTFAGTPSSEYKDKLARIEPRVATYLMGSLKTLFGLEDKEIGNFLGRMIGDVEGAADKINLMPTLIMQAKGFSMNENPAAYDADIEQMLKTGKLFNASKEFAVAFMNANMENNPDALVRFFESSTYKAGIIGEQDAFGAVFNIEDMFRNADDTIDEEGLRLLRSKIGNKSQIVLPMQKALEIVSGIELKRDEGDMKIQGQYYRQLNDAMHALSTSKNITNVEAKEKLISGALESIGSMNETSGKIMRNLFSGRIKGSATIEGKGIRLGDLRPTRLHDDAGINKRVSQKLNKAFSASMGYTVFMDTQAFMNTISSMTDEEKLIQTKKFMLGMEEVGFDVDKATGQLTQKAAKDVAPEGIKASVFRNPFLGPTHMAVMTNIFRFDSEFLESHKEFGNVLASNKESSGFRSLNILEQMLGSDEFERAVLGSDKELSEVKDRFGNKLTFRDISLVYKAMEANPDLFKDVKLTSQSIQERIDKKDKSIGNLEIKLRDLERLKNPQRIIELYNSREVELAKKEFYQKSNLDAMDKLNLQKSELQKEINDLNKLTPEQKELKTIKKSDGTTETKVRHKYLKDFIDRIEKQGDKSKFIQDKLMNSRLRKEFGLYIKHQAELKGIDNSLVLDYSKNLNDASLDKQNYNDAFSKFKTDYLQDPNKYNNAYNQLQDKLYEQNKKNLFGGLDSSKQPITKPVADVSKERLELSLHKRLIQNQAKYVEKKLANQKDQISKIKDISKIQNPSVAQISEGVKDFKIGFLKSIDLLKVHEGYIDYDRISKKIPSEQRDIFISNIESNRDLGHVIKTLFSNDIPEKLFTFSVPEDFKNLLFDNDGKLINLPKDFDINDTETVKRFFTGQDITTLKEIINGLNNFEDPNDQNKKLNYSRNKRNYKLGLRDMTIGEFETFIKSNHAMIKSELTEYMDSALSNEEFKKLLTKEHLEELNKLDSDQRLIQFSKFLNDNLYKNVDYSKEQQQQKLVKIEAFKGLVGDTFDQNKKHSYYDAIQIAKNEKLGINKKLGRITEDSIDTIDEKVFNELMNLKTSINIKAFKDEKSLVGGKSLLLHAMQEELAEKSGKTDSYIFRGIANFAIISEQQLFMMDKQTQVLETNKELVFNKEQARQQRLIADYEKTKSTYGLDEKNLTFDIPKLLEEQKAKEGFNADLAGIKKPKEQIKILSENINIDYVLKGIHADVIKNYREGALKHTGNQLKKPLESRNLPGLLNYLNNQMSKNVFSQATKDALNIDIGERLLKNSNDEFFNFAKAEIEAVKNNLKDKNATKNLRNKAKEFKKAIIVKDLDELKRLKELSEIKNEEVRLRAQQLLEYKDKFESGADENTKKHINSIEDLLKKIKSSKDPAVLKDEADKLIATLDRTKVAGLDQKAKDLSRYTNNKNIVDSFLSSKFLNESSLVLSQEQAAGAEIYAAKKTLSERAKKQEKFDRFNRANDLITELENKEKALELETDDTKKTALNEQIKLQKEAISNELYEINNNQATSKQRKELQAKYEKQYDDRVTNKIAKFEYREPEVDSTGKVVIGSDGKPVIDKSKSGKTFSDLNEIKAFRDQLIQRDINAEIQKKTDKINKIDAKIAKKQEAIDKNKIKIGEVQAKIDLLKEQIGFGSSPKPEVEITDHLNQKYTVPTVHTQVFGESSTQELKTSDVEKIVGYKYEQPDQDLADKINYKYLQSNSKTHPEFAALDLKYNAVDLSSIPDLEELHKNEKEFKGAKDFDYNDHKMTPNKQLFKTDLQEKGSVRQLVLTQDQIDAAKTSTEKGTVGAKIISTQDKIKKLEAQKQKLEAKVAGGADATKKMEISLQEALDTALGEYTSSYSKVVGSGSGQIVFPEFESEFSFKDLKGNDINNFGIKVRTDLSRAMVGDFDADIYQAIIHDDKMVKHFQTQFDPANVGNFQRQGALFTLNMEMIKSGMDQFGKRLNEQTGQILDYKAFRYSEVQKEQILKGTVGAVDTTAKSAMIASMYSMMESKDDLAKMRKTHLAAQSLISAAQEIVVIKSKSLEQATDVGKRYKESIDEAFKTGNTQKFRDFLTQDLFKGTKFEEGFEVSKVITKDMPADLSDAYQKTLMKEPIRFDINSIMEGFENIVSTTRKMGLDKLASDKMFANVMASNRTIDSDVFNNLVNRMGLLESAITSEQLDDDQFSRLFNQISGLEGSNQVDNLMNSRAIKDVFSSLSNTRLAAATTAALGASYLLSADYSKETLSLDETFSDNRVNEKIAQKNLYEGYNRDAAIPSDAMQRPFYKDMVSRVQSPGETYIAKQQSFLMKGQVNSLQDAQYLNNMVLSNGGSSSMMVNDNRMPLTGNYIDKMMGE